jgi:O-antigen/teichoic acid export membrane protein
MKYFKKIESPIVKKIINNASWLMSEKVIAMFLGLFVTAIIARYFGPEQFGMFNYAFAFVTLFTAISTLGFETLIIKSLIDEEYEEGAILFTSFILRVISGCVLLTLTIVIINYIEPHENLLKLIVFILSFTMLFKAFEIIQYWLHRHQLGRTYSLIKISVYVFTSILKVLIVVLGGTIYHLALTYLIDAIIIGIILSVVYLNTTENKSNLTFKFSFARQLLSRSWYILLSGLMATLYMRIDQVMLGNMLDTTEEVGIYSAAVKIAEMWYFIPLAIITSFKPIIMEYKNTNRSGYYNILVKLYAIMIWIGIFIGCFILIFSKQIITLIYGPEFIRAADILSISVWAGTFAMLGTVRSLWLINENLQKYNLVFMSAGMIVNIALNFLLIPGIGSIGAAIATLVSQFLVGFLSSLFFKETKDSFFMTVKAFNPRKILNK